MDLGSDRITWYDYVTWYGYVIYCHIVCCALLDAIAALGSGVNVAGVCTASCTLTVSISQLHDALISG